ncbi:MAG: SurA N-terminal domain-containing protein [Prevotella sp.]|jgi:peptidyl-prolyl cis-trans isomerase D|nr:SurA N-terminal domain-containing protein [Prevotella sp.]
MAALQKIRSKSGLLIGIIAVGLLCFVLPWNEIVTGINKSKNKAFTVDGEVVSTEKYSERFLQWENFQKMVTGENSLREEISSVIRELTYQQMVTEMMLDEQANSLGLAVTTAELSDVVNSPNFGFILQRIRLVINPNSGNLEGIASMFANPQTGQFDKTVLTQFLNNVKTVITPDMPAQMRQEILMNQEIWAFIEHMLKYQLLQEKYASLVAGLILPGNTEAKAVFEDSKIQSNIAYVLQRYTTMPDSTVAKEVTDTEIKDLYELRKNNFKLDTELRKISYFVKDVIPSDEDFESVKKEMDDMHERLLTAENPSALVSDYSPIPTDIYISQPTLPLDMRNFAQSAAIGQVTDPERNGQAYVMYKLIDKISAADSVKIRVIPLPRGLESKIAAHISDSLLNVIKGGKDFTTLADEVMPGMKSEWVTELMIAGTGNDFVRKCFGASKGEILNLTTNNGQVQLIHIEDKTNPVSKVKLAVVQMSVSASDKTQNIMDNELNLFVSESGNLENFDKAAQAKGYNLVSNAIISPSEMSLGQASGSRPVIHWAFNEKKGSVKKFDLSDKRIIAIVKEEVKGSYMPVSEVSAMLKTELINNKKAEKIIAGLKSKNLTSLEAYAEAMSSRIDTVNFVTFQTNNISGVGYEPILNVYAKLGEVNKQGQPLKGNAGVYVLNITEKTENGNIFDLVQAKQTARQSNFYQLMSQAMFVLKEKMNVKDNRVKFW